MNSAKGRTILYYPDIQIPTAGSWIRKALLYWDQIAAIVPRSYDDSMDERALQRYAPEIRSLQSEGIFRPINPDRLFLDGNASGFVDDLQSFIKRDRHNAVPICNEPIFKDKVSQRIVDQLTVAGLAEDRGDGLFYFFEHDTACAYMALLAKHMATADSSMTVPGTDREGASDIAFGAYALDDSATGYYSRLKDILPVPSAKVPLSKILTFRSRYQSELLAFRAAIDDFEQTLAAAEASQTDGIVQSHKEKIRRECSELGKALQASKVSMVLGSLQAFIKPTSPTLIGASVVVAGKAAALASVPIEYIIAGSTFAGAIEVGAHLFNKFEENRKTLSNSPFAYVFLAQRKLLKE